MTQHQEPGTAVATRDDFRRAAEMYATALEAFRLASDCLRDAQAGLRAAQQAQSDAEIDLRLDPTIDGRNSEIREAQFQKIASDDDRYGDAVLAVEQSRRDVARWTDAAAIERDRMSGSKRAMEFCTMWLRFLSTEGGEA